MSKSEEDQGWYYYNYQFGEDFFIFGEKERTWILRIVEKNKIKYGRQHQNVIPSIWGSLKEHSSKNPQKNKIK